MLAAAHQLESRVYEFSRFLTDVAKVEDVGARYNGVVTYHDSCHALRELGVKAGPRRLLSNVKGLTLKETDTAEECCGFGGTFSVKFPEVSGGMARTKLESIARSGADTVVSIDSSCQMQGADGHTGPGQRALNLHQTARVDRNHGIRSATGDRLEFRARHAS